MKRDAVDVSVPSREVLQHRSALNMCQAYLCRGHWKAASADLEPSGGCTGGLSLIQVYLLLMVEWSCKPLAQYHAFIS